MAPMDRRIVQFYRQRLQQPDHLSYPLPEVLLEASIQDQIFNSHRHCSRRRDFQART
jgi:hypothetical protein